MPLFGQVATVAQLVGVDACGLITMITEAVRTVRQNRATCRQLSRQVEMLGHLLQQLHAVQASVAQRPETRRPVEELEETLRRACLLVMSCQRRGYVYRCFMGTRQADELREVQREIGFYLQVFPFLSYVDTTPASLLSQAGHPSGQEGIPLKTLKDIIKLGLAIKEIVETVRRNREECQRLQVLVAQNIAFLSWAENMGLTSHPATCSVLTGFKGSLDRAVKSVTDWQKRNSMHSIVMAAEMVKQLRQVQDDIQQTMLTMCMMEITINLTRPTVVRYDGVHPPPTQLLVPVAKLALRAPEYTL